MTTGLQNNMVVLDFARTIVERLLRNGTAADNGNLLRKHLYIVRDRFGHLKFGDGEGVSWIGHPLPLRFV